MPWERCKLTKEKNHGDTENHSGHWIHKSVKKYRKSLQSSHDINATTATGKACVEHMTNLQSNCIAEQKSDQSMMGLAHNLQQGYNLSNDD